LVGKHIKTAKWFGKKRETMDTHMDPYHFSSTPEFGELFGFPVEA
jgi:hypothetical protein